MHVQGAHPDAHFTRNRWPRNPYAQHLVLDIVANPTVAASGVGGIIFIEVPKSVTMRDGENGVAPVRFEVTIRNVVRAPLFIGNITTEQEHRARTHEVLALRWASDCVPGMYVVICIGMDAYMSMHMDLYIGKYTNMCIGIYVDMLTNMCPRLVRQ